MWFGLETALGNLGRQACNLTKLDEQLIIIPSYLETMD